MPPIELLIPFFAATLAFAIMPGPAILYTAAQTIARGRKGGFFAAFGIHVGGFIHVAAAAWPLWVQFIVLGTIVNVAFSLADVVTVLIATRMVRLVTQNSLGERLARWFSGSILVGLGVHLAVSRD